MAIDLKKRVGPLPVWAWLASVALGGVLLWRNMNRNPDQEAAATALSPYATPGFGLDPGTGAPISAGGGGTDSGLLQMIDALVQGQQGLGEAIGNLPLLFPTADPSAEPTLTDRIGDLGSILDLTDRLGGRLQAPAARPKHKIKRGPPRRGRKQIKGTGKRERRTNRQPGHPDEHKNVKRPSGHRQPAKPHTRFGARRAASRRQTAQHGGPTRTRRAPSIHKGPVAQAHTQRPQPAHSAPHRAPAPRPHKRQQQRRRGRR